MGLVDEGLLKKRNVVAAQDQALCTRNIRNVVYGENIQSICRVCDVAHERVTHIASECSKLA